MIRRQRAREHPSWLVAGILGALALMLVGCSDETGKGDSGVNPLAAYQPVTTTTGGLITNAQVQGVGQIDTPIVSQANPDGRRDHTNAPLLSNMHPGWQQNECFTCHTDRSRIPDHNYTDTSLCYLCHGTNGSPGFGDSTPPIIKGIVANPTQNSVQINFSTDEPCITRIVIRNQEGDRFDMPISGTYVQSHKFSFEGLLSSTPYNFEIIATDKNGNVTSTAAIGVLSFTTQAPAATSTGTGTQTDDENFFYDMVTQPGISDCWVEFKTRQNCDYVIYLQLPSQQVIDFTGHSTKDQLNRRQLTTQAGLRPDTEHVYRIKANRVEGTSQTYDTGKTRFKTLPF